MRNKKDQAKRTTRRRLRLHMKSRRQGLNHIVTLLAYGLPPPRWPIVVLDNPRKRTVLIDTYT